MHEALRTEEHTLGTMLEQRDLILVTGKGGTGKSTLVAALAELAARVRGRAVAVELAAHPRLHTLVAPGGRVQVVNLELEDATGHALARMLGMPALVGAIAKNRIIRQFIRTSPAARETILLDELLARVEAESKSRVPVIVDLPATGHAMTFLDTPRAVKKMLRVGPIAAAAEKAEILLHDPLRTELVVVAIPEELPINETIELVKKAREIGIATRRIVVNQVPAHPVEPHERELLDVVQQHGEGAVGAFAKTAHGDTQGADQARSLIEKLHQSVTSAQIIELPRLQGVDPRASVEAAMKVLSR
jgi:anion-transporting  ArsA/GET3 family ATPase